MAANIILICGKICSGKTTYINGLKVQRRAAVLSCDELMLALFPRQLGDAHEEISQKAQRYLLDRAAELALLDVPVILDWGFWTAESRRAVKDFFHSRGLKTELHYLHVNDSTWKKNMECRNSRDPQDAYFVDDNLAAKCAGLFEPPAREEVDLWVDNDW